MNTEIDIEKCWANAWHELGSDVPEDSVYLALITAYEEHGRHYHTLQHLKHCLNLLNEYQALSDRPHEIAIALWFHDAIYDTKGSDNEKKSAEWARKVLESQKIPADAVERIEAMILATYHTNIPSQRDDQLMVDIDLAILGSSPECFAEYEMQIRDEYRWVPAPIFKFKRSRVLGKFLDRTKIYGTPVLHDRFEQQARDNLAAAIN